MVIETDCRDTAPKAKESEGQEPPGTAWAKEGSSIRANQLPDCGLSLSRTEREQTSVVLRH